MPKQLLDRTTITVKELVAGKEGVGEYGPWKSFQVRVQDYKKGTYYSAYDNVIGNNDLAGKEIEVEFEAKKVGDNEYRTIKSWRYTDKGVEQISLGKMNQPVKEVEFKSVATDKMGEIVLDIADHEKRIKALEAFLPDTLAK